MSLLKVNIPYNLVLAGDEWLINRLSEKKLNRYELVIVPEPTIIAGAQGQLIENWKKRGKAVSWKNENDTAKLVKPLVSLRSQNRVWILPRTVPGKPSAPLVVHLVNWDYVDATDSFNMQSAIRIHLSRKLFERRVASKVTLLTPHGVPLELHFEEREDGIDITVPELALWGVLKVE